MTTLCVLAHLVPGRHLDGCTDTDCTGCTPAHAPQGSLCCAWHERGARKHLRELPGLYVDLGDPQRSKQVGGKRTDDHGSPMLIDDDRRNARSAIRLLFVAWCHTLEDDLRTTLPVDTVPAMARHIALHTTRLLNHPDHAEQLIVDLDNATTTAWRLARPRGHRGVRVQCTCTQWVPLDIDPSDATSIIRCTTCGEWGTVGWWRAKLAPKVDQPMTGADLCDWLLEQHRIATTRSTLRTWAERGKILRAGKDDAGATLYDPVEVASVLLAERARTA